MLRMTQGEIYFTIFEFSLATGYFRYNEKMSKWIVTGASGSVASACIEVLLSKGRLVTGYARGHIQDTSVSFNKVQNYRELEFDTTDCEGLLVAQGFFHYEPLETTSEANLCDLLEANFLSQIHVVRSFLQQVKRDQRVNIVILGSTSAFEAGRGTVVYGAAKAGMLAFVKGLNNEYLDTDIRFWLVSTGTLANEMGAKVPNQDPTSLLDVNLVAKEIIEKVTSNSNLWQPEITIRRRHIKLIN